LSSGLSVAAALIQPIVPLVETLVDAFTALPPVLQDATVAMGAFALAARMGPLGVVLGVLTAVGAAVELVNAAFGDGEKEIRRWQSSVAETAEDLQRLARVGRITGDLQQVPAVFEELVLTLVDARDEFNALERAARDASKIIRRMPLTPEKLGLVDVPNLETATEILARFRDELEPVDRALAQLVSSGNVKDAAAAFE